LFKRADMRRVIAPREAGLSIDRVEIDKTGKIIVRAASMGSEELKRPDPP
jgi:hypothetical protein